MKVCKECKSPYLQKEVSFGNQKVFTCLVCGCKNEKSSRIECDCPVCECQAPCSCECCDCNKEELKAEYPLC